MDLFLLVTGILVKTEVVVLVAFRDFCFVVVVCIHPAFIICCAPIVKVVVDNIVVNSILLMRQSIFF